MRQLQQQQSAIIPVYEIAVFLKGGNVFTTIASELEVKRSRWTGRIKMVRIDGIAPGAAFPNFTTREIQGVSWKHVGHFDPYAGQQPEGDHHAAVQSATEATEKAKAGGVVVGEEYTPGQSEEGGEQPEEPEPGPQAILGINGEEAARNIAEAIRAIAEHQPGEQPQAEQAAPGEKRPPVWSGSVRIQPKQLNRQQRRAQAKAQRRK